MLDILSDVYSYAESMLTDANINFCKLILTYPFHFWGYTYEDDLDPEKLGQRFFFTEGQGWITLIFSNENKSKYSLTLKWFLTRMMNDLSSINVTKISGFSHEDV